MIQTQSQNKEIKLVRIKIWREVSDEVAWCEVENKVRSKFGRKVRYKVWGKVGKKLDFDLWSEFFLWDNYKINWVLRETLRK